MNICTSCGCKNFDEAQFCMDCGKSLEGLKGRLRGISKRLAHTTKKAVDQMKTSVDQQITYYLNQFDRGEEVRIAGVRVPLTRRDSVQNALLSFQSRYLEGEPLQSKDYHEWLEDLPRRMEEHNCIVCFQKWEEKDSIVVCPYCNTGGHQDHLQNWITTNQLCPLCRHNLKKSELMKINF